MNSFTKELFETAYSEMLERKFKDKDITPANIIPIAFDCYVIYRDELISSWGDEILEYVQKCPMTKFHPGIITKLIDLADQHQVWFDVPHESHTHLWASSALAMIYWLHWRSIFMLEDMRFGYTNEEVAAFLEEKRLQGHWRYTKNGSLVAQQSMF